MKFVLDENVTWTLLKRLRRLGHEGVAVAHTESSASDRDVFGLCLQDRAVLVTCDSDFLNKKDHYSPAKIGGVIFLAGDWPAAKQVALVEQFVRSEVFARMQGSIVVLSKMAVRRCETGDDDVHEVPRVGHESSDRAARGETRNHVSLPIA